MSRRVQKKTVVQEEVVNEPEESSKEEIIEAFEYFDRDGRGTINKDELRVILTKLGTPMSEEEVNEIFKEAGLDDQPNVNYREFVEYWESQ
jgi:calmodulin